MQFHFKKIFFSTIFNSCLFTLLIIGLQNKITPSTFFDHSKWLYYKENSNKFQDKLNVVKIPQKADTDLFANAIKALMKKK